MDLSHPSDRPGRIVGFLHAAVLVLTLVGVRGAGADQIDDFTRQLSEDFATIAAKDAVLIFDVVENFDLALPESGSIMIKGARISLRSLRFGISADLRSTGCVLG